MDKQEDQEERDVLQKAMWRLSGKLRKEGPIDARDAVDHLLIDADKLSTKKNDETK